MGESVQVVCESVKVRCLTTVSEWDALEETWCSLWEASESATIFQSFVWLREWWRFYGRRKRLRILQAVKGKETIGFFPLMQVGKTLRFLGTGGTDYLDFFAQSGTESEVSAAFFDYIDNKLPGWAWLDLQEIRPTSLAHNLSSPDLSSMTIWEGETCPYLSLNKNGASWEVFSKTLGKSLRSNIGYYQRQMEKKHVFNLRLSTLETLDSDMDALFALHQHRWNERFMPGVFASERAKNFHRAVAKGFLSSGHLRLHLLTLDETTHAALYCFQKGTTCYYYAGGFDTSIAKLSPGTVLTGHAIRYAIEQDRAAEFDFLRGDEGYKYRWGAVDRFNRRQVATRGVLGPILCGVGHIAYQSEKALKHKMHAYFDKTKTKKGKGEK